MLKNLMDYNLGEEFDQVLLIKHAQLFHTKKGTTYLMLELADKSGSMRANLWDADEEDWAKYPTGDLVAVNGVIDEYQNRPQIKIFSIRPINNDNGYDLSSFVKKAPEASASMKEEINDYVFKILNPTWNRIVRYLLEKWSNKFYAFPAAKSNHHATQAGLAYHTLSMLRDAEAISKNYPQVNQSLLFAGCILHDLGKVIEFTGPVATRYTTAGNLLGHLVIGDEEIVLAANELKIDKESEDVVLLRHMVISHHGLPEYGAAKRPALLEAELLHRIDDLDASIYEITKALQETKPGEFTNPIFAQSGRKFYRPKNSDLDKIDKLN